MKNVGETGLQFSAGNARWCDTTALPNLLLKSSYPSIIITKTLLNSLYYMNGF